MTSLETALAYAIRGWFVLPIWPVVDGHCACCPPDSPRSRHMLPKERCDSLIQGTPRPAPGKHPIGFLCPRGHHSASDDADQIRSWWATYPTANIGINLERSGLVVLDVDGPEGRESFAQIVEQLAPTLTATTGSGGAHAIYALPEGVHAGRKIKFHPGLDLLGKGYIVAAPSNHISGGAYHWDDTTITIAPLPALLVGIAGSARPEHQKTATEQTSASRAVLASATAKVFAMGQAVERGREGGGGGNNHTFKVACVLVNDYDMTDDDALAVLTPWNALNDPAWTEDELLAFLSNARKHSSGETGVARAAAETLDLIKTSRGAEQTATTPTTQPEGGREYGPDLLEYLGASDPGDDPDAWLIHGVIAACVPQVIVGPPKSKKTFIAEHQAIAIAAGIPWLGRATKRERVLILAREDSFKETRRRIWRLARGMGIDPRSLSPSPGTPLGWLRVDSTSAFYFHEYEHIVAMRRTLENFKPGYVLVDSLSRTHVGDENSKKDMAVVTTAWGEFCQEFNLAFSMIHHVPKVNQGSLIQRIRGSGDIGAVVRYIIGVDKVGKEASSLEFDGNLAPLPDPFNVKIADGIDAQKRPTITITAAESHHSKQDEMRAKIIEAHAATGGVGLNAREFRVKCGKTKAWSEVRDILIVEGVLYLLHTDKHRTFLRAGNNPPAARVQSTGGNEG